MVPQMRSFVWTLGPIQRALPDFEVIRVSPSKPREPWLYVSLGAWNARKGSTHGYEFLMLSAVADPIHIESLSMVAKLHADPQYGVREGQVIEIGRPWMDGSLRDHFLASLPYPFGPAFEHCVIGGFHVRFLWLLPVTRGEAAFLREHGQEAVEVKLEAAGIDATNPRRKPVE